MPPRRRNAGSSSVDEEYRRKRERNNLAVKKCRIKSYQKAEEMKGQKEHYESKTQELKGKIEELEKFNQTLEELITKNASPAVLKIVQKIKDNTYVE